MGKLLSIMKLLNVGWGDEIIIVWDGGYQYSQLEFYHSVRWIEGDNQGLGAAILKGCRAARNENIIVMDGDGQHPPSALPVIANYLAMGAEFVGGRRTNRPGMSWQRRAMSNLCGLPARIIAPHAEPMTGLFGFKRELLDRATMRPTSWKVGLEIAVKGRPAQVDNVDYVFCSRFAGKSHAGIKPALQYLRHLVELYAWVIDFQRMLKFCLVGSLGVLINLGVLFSVVEIFGLPYGFGAVLGIGVAMLSNYGLNKVWTFKDGNKHQGNQSLARESRQH